MSISTPPPWSKQLPTVIEDEILDYFPIPWSLQVSPHMEYDDRLYSLQTQRNKSAPPLPPRHRSRNSKRSNGRNLFKTKSSTADRSEQSNKTISTSTIPLIQDADSPSVTFSEFLTIAEFDPTQPSHPKRPKQLKRRKLLQDPPEERPDGPFASKRTTGSNAGVYQTGERFWKRLFCGPTPNNQAAKSSLAARPVRSILRLPVGYSQLPSRPPSLCQNLYSSSSSSSNNINSDSGDGNIDGIMSNDSRNSVIGYNHVDIEIKNHNRSSSKGNSNSTSNDTTSSQVHVEQSLDTPSSMNTTTISLSSSSAPASMTDSSPSTVSPMNSSSAVSTSPTNTNSDTTQSSNDTTSWETASVTDSNLSTLSPPPLPTAISTTTTPPSPDTDPKSTTTTSWETVSETDSHLSTLSPILLPTPDSTASMTTTNSSTLTTKSPRSENQQQPDPGSPGSSTSVTSIGTSSSVYSQPSAEADDADEFATDSASSEASSLTDMVLRSSLKTLQAYDKAFVHHPTVSPFVEGYPLTHSSLSHRHISSSRTPQQGEKRPCCHHHEQPQSQTRTEQQSHHLGEHQQSNSDHEFVYEKLNELSQALSQFDVRTVKIISHGNDNENDNGDRDDHDHGCNHGCGHGAGNPSRSKKSITVDEGDENNERILNLFHMICNRATASGYIQVPDEDVMKAVNLYLSLEVDIQHDYYPHNQTDTDAAGTRPDLLDILCPINIRSKARASSLIMRAFHTYTRIHQLLKL